MARQFREQLEQEVNSINEVKPVPRNVPPEVGPTPPDVTPANNSEHADMGSTAATGVADSVPVAPDAAPAAAAEPVGSDTHPEAQIYFSLNGTEPEVVAHDPHAPQPAAAEPQAAIEPAAAAEPGPPALPGEGGGETGPAIPPAAAAKQADPSQPATVEVIFPHDHG